MISIISPVNVDRTVRNVLNSPRFINAKKQELSGFNNKSFFQNIIDGIKEFFEKYFGAVNKSIHIKPYKGSSAPYYVESAVFLLILLFIAFLITRFILKKEKVKLKFNIQHEDKIDLNKNYMQLAEKMIEDDDLKGAIRYAFWSILVELNRLKVLDIKDSKTNYQYIIEIRRKSLKNTKDFEKCVDIFNEVWYGNREPSFEKVKKCCDYYNAIASDGGNLK